MREIAEFPHQVTEDEHISIPLRDGVQLAARIWRPATSGTYPVPGIVEFIPYRKRDFTAVRDSIHHPYLAGHGYACVRADLRGSGDSEGVLTDEYLDTELADAEEVLSWVADQPWCTGRTGMMGISWGGFNALQVAARRPDSLGAIATVCSSDDRYSDDVHYMGGCLLGDNLSWASTMFAYNSSPPDPELVGERWRDLWLERLRNSGLWLDQWMRHQHRDDYWRHGSICEDYGSIACPVLAVSGWADGYSNAVFRLLAELGVPCRGLIGPWSHKYPHLGEPGPAVGFLQELVRWWDHWLKDVDNGVLHTPALRTWMQDSVPPSTAYEERPGRWVGEPYWPSPHVTSEMFTLVPNGIVPVGQRLDAEELTVESPLSVGQFAGKWCSYSAPPDLPYDQREEDGGSLVFDSTTLTERHEVLGAPVLELEIAVNKPVAMVAARLSDVLPDGRTTRVTYGLLNLTHRGGDAEPEPLEPGKRYRVTVTLNGVAQAFPPGHRIRLSLSTSYWPLAWPPPEPARLSVFTGDSALWLPFRRLPEDTRSSEVEFDEPVGAYPVRTTQLRPGTQQWRVNRELVNYSSELRVVKDAGTWLLDDIDLRLSKRVEERYSWIGDDFDSVRGEVTTWLGFARAGWRVSTMTHTVLTSNRTHFQLHARLDAYEHDMRVVSLNWNKEIERNCV
ncbi:hypothetical protein EV191_12344 [Tamaricihabitans halophyticus]|uniref:Xaa-Pro dipeptidyl-peptidase C-terminal domain-containing protein n=1 Tax=Tamaricihabitans halophyticus TaxID=1262583 RepID=A0A4R2Q444_9PSEU|nr:CocE/NonD family hydrolase [Tamaricihabitans halophyticus]TCP42644.1 hypothetical protein EV191_12344 [Tamaricihabitans halophyticus]